MKLFINKEESFLANSLSIIFILFFSWIIMLIIKLITSKAKISKFCKFTNFYILETFKYKIRQIMVMSFPMCLNYLMA